jgi:hypothetical protein
MYTKIAHARAVSSYCQLGAALAIADHPMKGTIMLGNTVVAAAIVAGALMPITAASSAHASDSTPAPAATCARESWTPSTGVIAASCTGPGAVLFHVQCASPQYDRSSGWLVVPTAGRTMTHLVPGLHRHVQGDGVDTGSRVGAEMSQSARAFE